MQERVLLLFRATISSLEWLDEVTVLASGYARYPRDPGWAESAVWWLNEFRDGMLWRVRGFFRKDDARQAHASRSGTAE
jgi:hypothetical protein